MSRTINRAICCFTMSEDWSCNYLGLVVPPSCDLLRSQNIQISHSRSWLGFEHAQNFSRFIFSTKIGQRSYTVAIQSHIQSYDPLPTDRRSTKLAIAAGRSLLLCSVCLRHKCERGISIRLYADNASLSFVIEMV